MADTNNPTYGQPAANDPEFSPGNPEFTQEPVAYDPLAEDVAPPPADTSGDSESKRLASDAGDRAKDVAGVARDDARQVADTTKQAGSDVMESAKREGGHVVDEAKVQGKQLLDESIQEFRAQAGQGQNRIAGLVRSMSDELNGMSDSAMEQGPMVDLVHRAGRIGQDAANFLENNDPDAVVDSVRRYAARNPWTFLAISAGVGFVGARFVRGLKRDDSQDHQGVQRQVQAPYQGGQQFAAPSYSADQTQRHGDDSARRAEYGTAEPQTGDDFGVHDPHDSDEVISEPGYAVNDPQYPSDPRGGAPLQQEDFNRREGLR